ncbi:glycosyltransferase [Bacillus sp. 1P02SD]|uniref:glycosyltransferase n=1 Tax=Bacillus sp. 1P02SD TaxID=3132264 RepID=UPI0039A1BAFC
MKKSVLISMYSMNIGGAERSLIGLLESFDSTLFDIDLFLYRQEGEFLGLVPKKINLLRSITEYTTFERPIKDVLKEGHYYLGCMRILAKVIAKYASLNKSNCTYKQMQYTWELSMPKLPKLEKKYDLAISFLGPHNFILDKVDADIKIGWNHTDYFTIVNPDRKIDEKMWGKLDYIVNVSKDCEDSFLKVFPSLRHKSIVIENILSAEFVREQSNYNIKDEMPDDGTIKICSVGRFSEAKGFDLAVIACKKLVDLGYKLRWYIVGYGGDEKYIKQLIKDNEIGENFILLGKKVNPYPYIKECDVYCQPSRYEGKAVTVREAQILGKPVVITRYPTSNSQVCDGIDGIITSIGIDGIVEGIRKIIDNKDLREKLILKTLNTDYSNRGEINKIYSLLKIMLTA